MIGTSDQSCWLVEACKILLLLFLLGLIPPHCVCNRLQLLLQRLAKYLYVANHA